tara:strand:- start:22 stop:657 length:636 start_codon:yes stop_codon:yes gene_type:complete
MRKNTSPAEHAHVVRGYMDQVFTLCRQLEQLKFLEKGAVSGPGPETIKFIEPGPVPRVKQGDSWANVSQNLAEWQPKLMQGPDADRVIAWKGYKEQRRMRRFGKSYARWIFAQAGTFTGPHLDLDINGEAMHTALQQMVGECIVVAWRANELPLDRLDLDNPSTWCDQVKGLTSLSVVRMNGEAAIRFLAGTVHLVITAEDKEHLSFHMYP